MKPAATDNSGKKDMTTIDNITGKKISELVSEGYFGKSFKDIPKATDNSRQEFEEKVESTDLYKKYFEKFTSTTLTGSEKQISWAEKIRAKKANQYVFNYVLDMIINAFCVDTIDINKRWTPRFAELKETSASKWIDNRFQ